MGLRTPTILGGYLAALLLPLALPGPASAELSRAQKDSGWVDLFDGTDFNGLYTYLVGDGLNGNNYNNDPKGTFKAEKGMIHGSNTVNQGHIGTAKEYSRYRCRVDYRLTGTGGSTNAGFVYHIDTASWKLYDQHPRSVECQMKHNEAGWAFLIANVTMTTTVDPSTKGQDTPLFMDASLGGVAYVQGDRDPKRTVKSSSHTEHYPPDSAWNTEEIRVYGADSIFHVVNGKVVLKGTKLLYDKVKDDSTVKLPLSKGRIGLQAEGNEVWYRNWHIMLLDPQGNPVAVARRQAMRNGGGPAGGPRGPMLMPLKSGSGGFGGMRLWNGEALLDIQGRGTQGRSWGRVLRMSSLPVFNASEP